MKHTFVYLANVLSSKIAFGLRKSKLILDFYSYNLCLQPMLHNGTILTAKPVLKELAKQKSLFRGKASY